MKLQKLAKGDFGYPVYERKVVIIRTAVYFIMSIAVFLLGYFSTGSKENLLTIVAVLGLLPSSKSLVSVIMYLRIPKYSQKAYKEISAREGNVPVIYSMYLTSYKLNFPINAFAVKGNNLIGYTEFKNCNVSACEEHIRDIFKQNGIKNITIKIFSDQKRFMERLDQLQELEAGKKEDEILTLLGDISL
jgi:hypothetical protein